MSKKRSSECLRPSRRSFSKPRVIDRVINPVVEEADEDGMPRWKFSVDMAKFGHAQCSYDPKTALNTLMDYFKRTYLASDWFQDKPLYQKQFEELDVSKIHHPNPFKRYEYAAAVLQEVLPDVVALAIRQAVHVAIHRTIWDLEGKTHRLTGGQKRTGTTKMVLEPANRDVRKLLNNKPGPREKITSGKINSAYRKLGSAAGLTEITIELDVTDRGLEKWWKKRGCDNYDQFRESVNARNK
jgi:hypothetical protein